MQLRYVYLPANSGSPLEERSIHLESATLSYDVAYLLPILLKDVPATLKAGATFVPYPTFNECLSDDVPFILYNKAENRLKQENSRAKTLVERFLDKFARKQTFFGGDVFVFWRRSVEEKHHQLKLVDFPVSEALEILQPHHHDLSQKHTTQPASETQSLHQVAVECPENDVTEFPCDKKNISLSPQNQNITQKTHQKQRLNHRYVDNEDVDLGSSHSSQLKSTVYQKTVMVSRVAGKRVDEPGVARPTVLKNVSNHVPTAAECSTEGDTRSGVAAGFDGFALNGNKWSDTRSGDGEAGMIALRRNSLKAQTVAEATCVLQSFVETFLKQLPLVDKALKTLSQLTTGAQGDTSQCGVTYELLMKYLLGNHVCENGHRMYPCEKTKVSKKLSKTVKGDTESLTTLRPNERHGEGASHQDLREDAALAHRQGAGARSTRHQRRVMVFMSTVVFSCCLKRKPVFRSQTSASQRGVETLELEKWRSVSDNGVTSTSSCTADKAPLVMPSSQVTAESGSQETDSTRPDHMTPVTAKKSCEKTLTGDKKNPALGCSQINCYKDLERRTRASKRQWIVNQVYKPSKATSNDRFATLAVGDVVIVEREDTSGWWWVSNSSTSGWYPFSFLESMP